MKVVVYTPGYNETLTNVLTAFAEGIPGAEIHDQSDYVPADVAVIFGVFKQAYKPTWTKKIIMDHHSGRSLIIVESAFIRRKRFYQIGLGGFAGGADFRNDDVPMDRWEAISVPSKPWQKRPDGQVVVMGQLPRDTSVQSTNHIRWCQETVRYYEAQGLPVVFRPHPRIDNPDVYGIDPALWDERKLIHSLREARVFVTYNSTTGVDGAVKGVPVIACDKGSMAWPVSHHQLRDIHRLQYPSRHKWLAGLGYAQWTLDEMREGMPWRHLTRE